MTTTWDSTYQSGAITLSGLDVTATGTGSVMPIGVAVDFTHGKIWFLVSDTGQTQWNGGARATQDPATNTGGISISGLAAGAKFPAFSGYGGSTNDTVDVNFGGSAFTYGPPGGFSSWDALAGSATTWNPSDKDAGITLSNGNLTASRASGNSAYKTVRGTNSLSSGLAYFEFTPTAIDNLNGFIVGIANSTLALSGFCGTDTNGIGYRANGDTYISSAGATVTAYNASTTTGWRGVRGTTSKSSGKLVFEITATADSSRFLFVGLGNASWPYGGDFPGADATGAGYEGSGNFFSAGTSNVTSGDTFTTGDVIMVAVDFSAAKVWYYNPVAARWNNAASGTQNPATGTGGFSISGISGALFPVFSCFKGGSVYAGTLNASGSFSNATPSGFSSWDPPANATLSPTGIATDEALGSPTLTGGAVVLSPTGIPSDEAMGSPSLSTTATTLFPTGIPSDEAVGGAAFPWISPAVLAPGPALRFLAVEIEAFKPGGTSLTKTPAWAKVPWAGLALDKGKLESTGMIFASDLGYRTAPGDVDGPVPYAALLDQAFSVDNRMNLNPASSAAAAGWGSIVLANSGRRFDGIAASWNSDGRAVRILTGKKPWDATRRYHTDPVYSALTLLFAGFAAPWFLSDVSLTIPLRDATYWLERPYQPSLYGGTGGYDGTTALVGKPIPRTRGGTPAHPVPNVTPVLIDPVNLIYQYNDGPGTVRALFEGAAETITFDADTADLYSGSTTPGEYRTDNSRGLFQLGSPPAHAITANVTGEFPIAGAVTTAIAIARYLLTEDLSLPADNIDLGSFSDADAAWNYTAGFYVDTADAQSGVDVVAGVLGGLGAKLVGRRDGTLGVLVLRALPATARAVAAWGPEVIKSLVPKPLSAPLSPPPYRWRVQYNANHTVQTSDLNTASADPDQLQFVAGTGPLVSAGNTDVLAAYRRPSDPPPLAGALLVEAEAQEVADGLAELFGPRRRLYDATVPGEHFLTRDLGDVVSLTYPLDDLPAARLGQIVGYQYRAADAAVTFQILV